MSATAAAAAPHHPRPIVATALSPSIPVVDLQMRTVFNNNRNRVGIAIVVRGCPLRALALHNGWSNHNRTEPAMKGDGKVLEHLTAQLKNELTASNQYCLRYRLLTHSGFERLAKREYEESIGEMKHADPLMERILVLEGLPNLQDLGKLLVGENVPEILDC